MVARIRDAASPAIGVPLATELLRDWDNVAEHLAAAGLSDPATIALVRDIVPEMLGAILLLRAADAERPPAVTVAIAGERVPVVSLALETLPLYRALVEVLLSNSVPGDEPVNIALTSGVAHTLSQAMQAGANLAGARVAVSLVGVRHDGTRLIVAR